VLRLIDDGSLDPSPMPAGPFGYDDAVEVLLEPPPALARSWNGLEHRTVRLY
jgi:alcohol dehydrogenase